MLYSSRRNDEGLPVWEWPWASSAFALVQKTAGLAFAVESKRGGGTESFLKATKEADDGARTRDHEVKSLALYRLRG